MFDVSHVKQRMNIVDYSSSEEEAKAQNSFIQMTPKMFNLMQRNKSREVHQEVMTQGIQSQRVIPKKQLITPGSEQFVKQVDIDIFDVPKSEFNFKNVGNCQICTIPKKVIFTYEGHKKGVNCARYFPNFGHVFVSASNDCTMKIWDLYRDKQCLATIAGHNKGVRDVNWSHTGNKIISASFDKHVKIFDVKKEKSIFTWTVGKIPYVVKFHPQKEHLFLVGCGDRKIYQVDIRANEIIHEYDDHRGQINSINFLDNGARFVSTADDKTLRVFEFDLPLAVGYKSEPGLNAISNTVIHPDGEWILCQSFANAILCFGSAGKYRISKKRRFTGHDIAGYGCNLNISPDGKFVMSGDSHGKLYFWSWKTQKILLSYKNHKDVVMDCQFDPQQPSRVLTASWDNSIKLWE
eukprot:NODE_272_length_12196_cov_0.228404.p3 type:complete len:407 gc:universal NODE_272_length_12196_cov_0.228404:8814-7594(-)